MPVLMGHLSRVQHDEFAGSKTDSRTLGSYIYRIYMLEMCALPKQQEYRQEQGKSLSDAMVDAWNGNLGGIQNQ